MRIVKIIGVSTAIIAGTIALAWKLMLPAAIEREVRARLDDAGFVHAQFEVGKIALDRVELLDVSLADGLALGDVEIAAGPYALWRGARPDIVLHAPRIDARAARGGHGRHALPFRRVLIEDGEVDVGADRIAVRGAIDLRGPDPRLDLEAYTKSFRIGDAALDDVAATIRGPSRDLRICATAHAVHARVDACAQLDAIARDAAALTWSAHDDGAMWSATGAGRLVRHGDDVALEAGVVDAVMTGNIDGVAIEGATAHAELAGTRDAFVAKGELRATSIANETVAVRGAQLPFELAGDLGHLHSEHALAMSATSAIVKALGKELRIEAPIVIARGTTGPLTAGSDEPLQIVTKLRGIPLDRVLRATTRDRVRATGVLDGEFVFGIDHGKLALVGGGLVARTSGRLVTANLGVQHRVAAALADFLYSHFELRVRDRVLQLVLQGRGRKTPQALDIDVNVRGLLAHTEGNR